jgi:hypothetical protein
MTSSDLTHALDAIEQQIDVIRREADCIEFLTRTNYRRDYGCPRRLASSCLSRRRPVTNLLQGQCRKLLMPLVSWPKAYSRRVHVAPAYQLWDAWILDLNTKWYGSDVADGRPPRSSACLIARTAGWRNQ